MLINQWAIPEMWVLMGVVRQAQVGASDETWMCPLVFVECRHARAGPSRASSPRGESP